MGLACPFVYAMHACCMHLTILQLGMLAGLAAATAGCRHAVVLLRCLREYSIGLQQWGLQAKG